MFPRLLDLSIIWSMPSSLTFTEMKIKTPHTHHRSGAIFVELLIAVFILGTAVLAIYLSIIYAGKVNQRARNLNLAQQIASQEIESLRSTSFSNITVPYNGAFIGNPQNASQILPTASANLTTSWFDANNTQIKAVVTISWKERTQNRTLSYTTVIGKQGLNP